MRTGKAPVIAAMVLVTGLSAAACASAATSIQATAAPATSAGGSAAPSPTGTAGRAYPGQAADAALCRTYNADISSGDTYGVQTALQQATGSVSPKLARDIQAVVNGTTLRQDMSAQIKVVFDCALVQAGKPPGG